MSRADNLAGLLHQMRSPTATLDTIHELNAAVRAASPEEAAQALLQFGYDLLSAARNVYRVQVAVAELDAHEGGLQ